MGDIQHYRTMAAKTPFTLAQLESFCATLRTHGISGDQTIQCSYQVELTVRIEESLFTPAQLKAM